MNEQELTNKVREIAAEIINKFTDETGPMGQIGQDFLLEDKGLSPEKQSKIKKEMIVDVRIPALMARSGKGGWTSDAKLAANWAQSANVTLLEHLLSVARGAMVFRGYQWIKSVEARQFVSNESLFESSLREEMATAFIVGFLHDANKALQKRSLDDVSESELKELMDRWAIGAFWTDLVPNIKSEIPTKAWLLMVKGSEQTSAHASGGHSRVSNEAVVCVQLADRLDGAWLKGGAEGLKAAVREEGATGSARAHALGEWDALSIFDPHHPFLLDLLLANITIVCRNDFDTAPLIAIHQDGTLFAMLPKGKKTGILEKALNRMGKKELVPKLEILVNNKKAVRLVGGTPSFMDVVDAVRSDWASASKAVAVQKKWAAVATNNNTILALQNLFPNWSFSAPGELGAYFEVIKQNLNAPGGWLFVFGALSVILSIQPEKIKKEIVASPVMRRDELGEWLAKKTGNAIKPFAGADSGDLLTMSVMAAWQTVAELTQIEAGGLETEAELIEQLSVIVNSWLEGDESIGRIGLSSFLEGAEGPLVDVKARFMALGQGEAIGTLADERKEKRCLFTNEPVEDNAASVVSGALQLYGVKSSAFSARQGRENNLMTAPPSGDTHVSAVSKAEHQLRKRMAQSKKEGDVSFFVSSPIGGGLFATVAWDGKFDERSTFDLLREDRKDPLKVTVGRTESAKSNRVMRLGRYEEYPARFEDQLDFFIKWLKVTRRYGRPVHIFRGLPSAQKSFFFSDSVPPALMNILPKNGLRIEQMRDAIAQLEFAKKVADVAGLGVVWAKKWIENPSSWQVLAKIEKVANAKDDSGVARGAQEKLEMFFEQLKKGERIMQKRDGWLVDLAKLAVMFQKNPGYSGSNNEWELSWSIAWGAWILAKKEGRGELDAKDMIAGSLSKELERKGKMMGGKAAESALIDFSEKFAQMIAEVHNGRKPSGDYMSTLNAAYAFAFKRSMKDFFAQRANAQKEVSPESSTPDVV